MSVLDEIRNDINGAAILNDWLGAGGHPVSQETSDHRSLACVRGNNGEICRENVAPKWWETAKGKIADAIRSQLELKNKLRMTTPLESHLSMCRVCGCCLPLKVFVPIQHIKAHTPSEMLARYPSFCWQRKEMEQHA
jgi:hypothetical protein